MTLADEEARLRSESAYARSCGADTEADYLRRRADDLAGRPNGGVLSGNGTARPGAPRAKWFSGVDVDMAAVDAWFGPDETAQGDVQVTGEIGDLGELVAAPTAQRLLFWHDRAGLGVLELAEVSGLAPEEVAARVEAARRTTVTTEEKR
jgi:hypothetical protein